MSDRIHVAIRVRPLNAREAAHGTAWSSDETAISQLNPETGRPTDRVYGQNEGSEEIYANTASDIIKSALAGVNGTIFAYGQTSSGKTFTMRGNTESPGIILLAIEDVFKYIQNSPHLDFLLRVSYMEIYNEVITDLLNPINTNLKVHEDIERGVFVGGVTEEIVTSQFQVLSILARGDANRKVGRTNMNEYSSRSHSIFRMVIESSEKDANGEDSKGGRGHAAPRRSVPVPGNRGAASSLGLLGKNAVKVSLLNLVDLAGSERAQQTGAEGMRLKEGAHINKSLLTLERVISKLSEGKSAAHIPYRDSRLTRILQPALGGNSRTAIICTVTPALVFQEESHSTLKFANSAKKISNKPQVNEVLDDKALLKRYLNKISSLEEQIDSLKRQQQEEAVSTASSPRNSTPSSPFGASSSICKTGVNLFTTDEEVFKRREELSQLNEGIVSASKLKRVAKNRRQTWCPGPSMIASDIELILSPSSSGSSTPQHGGGSLLNVASASNNLLIEDEFDLMLSSASKTSISRASSGFSLLPTSPDLLDEVVVASSALSSQNSQFHLDRIAQLEAQLAETQAALQEAQLSLEAVGDANEQLEAKQAALDAAELLCDELKRTNEEKSRTMEDSMLVAQEHMTKTSELESRITELEAQLQESDANADEQMRMLTEEHLSEEEKLKEEIEALKSQSNDRSEIESLLLEQQAMLEQQAIEMQELRSETQNLRVEAMDVSERLKLSEASLDASREKSHSLEAQLASTIKERSELADQNATAASMAQELQLALQALQLDVEVFRAERESFALEMDTLKTGREKMELELRSQLSSDMNPALDAQIQELRTENQSLRIELAESNKLADLRSQELISALSQLGSLKNAVLEKDTLKCELSEAKESESELEIRLGHATEEIASLTSQIEELKASASSDARSSLQQSQELEFTTMKDHYETTIETLKAEIASGHSELRHSRSESNLRISQLESSVDNIKSDKSSLEAQLSAALQASETAKNEAEDLRTQLRLLQSESHSSNTLHSQHEASIDQWKKKATQLQTALSLTEQASERLEVQLAELRDENKRLLSNSALLERKDEELGIANVKIEQLRKQVASMTSVGSQFEDSSRRYETEIAELKLELSRTKSSITRINVLEDENKELQREIGVLKAERKANADSAGSGGAKVKAMQSEIDQLERKLSAVSASVNEAEDQKLEAEEKEKRVSKELASLRSQFEAIVAKHKSEKQSLASKESEFEDRLRRVCESKDEMVAELETLREENARLDRELTQYSKQMDAWQAHAGEAASRMQAAAQEKAALEQRSAELAEACESLRIETSELQSREKLLLKRHDMELKAVSDELAALKKETKAAGAKKVAMEKEKESSARDLEKLKELLQKERDRCQQLTQDKSSLVQEKATQERELKTAKAALANLESVMKKAEGAGSKSETKLKEVQTAFAQLEKKHAELIKAHDKLERLNETLSTDSTKFKSDADKLKADLEKTKTEIERMKEEARELQLDLERCQTNLVEAETDKSKLQDDCQAHERTIALLQTDAETSEQVLDDARMQYNTALNELQTATDRVSELGAEIAALQEASNLKDQEILRNQEHVQQIQAEFEAQVAQLNEALVETSMEKEEAKAALNEALDDAAKITDELQAKSEEVNVLLAQLKDKSEALSATSDLLESKEQEFIVTLKAKEQDFVALIKIKDDDITQRNELLMQTTNELSLRSEELDIIKMQLETVESNFQSLSQECSELAEERDALFKERDSLQISLEQISLQHDTLVSEQATLASLYEDLRVKHESIVSERNTLQTEAVEMATQNASLRAECDRVNAELLSLTEELGRITTEKDTEIAALSEQHTTLTTDAEQMERTLAIVSKEKEEAINAYESRITAAQTRLEQLTAELNESISVHTADQEKIAELTQLSEETVTSMETISQSLAESRAESESLKAQLESKTLEMAKLAEEFHSLEQSSELQRTEAGEAQIRAAVTAEAQLQALSAELAESKEHLRAQIAEAVKAQELIAAKESESSELLSQVEQYKSQAEEMKAQVEELQEAVEHYKAEEESAGTMMQAQEQQLSDATKQLADAQAQLKQFKKGYAQKKLQLEQMKTHYENLKQAAVAATNANVIAPLPSSATTTPLSKAPNAHQVQEANKENTVQQILF